MRCHIRLVLDDEMQCLQWSSDIYAENGRKLRTLVRAAGGEPPTTAMEALDEALQDLHSLYRTPPLYFNEP